MRKKMCFALDLNRLESWPSCQGRLGRLTIDVKDDVVGLDVPMDVVQIGVDVVNGLSIKSLCQAPTKKSQLGISTRKHGDNACDWRS